MKIRHLIEDKEMVVIKREIKSFGGRGKLLGWILGTALLVGAGAFPVHSAEAAIVPQKGADLALQATTQSQSPLFWLVTEPNERVPVQYLDEIEPHEIEEVADMVENAVQQHERALMGILRLKTDIK